MGSQNSVLSAFTESHHGATFKFRGDRAKSRSKPRPIYHLGNGKHQNHREDKRVLTQGPSIASRKCRSRMQLKRRRRNTSAASTTGGMFLKDPRTKETIAVLQVSGLCFQIFCPKPCFAAQEASSARSLHGQPLYEWGRVERLKGGSYALYMAAAPEVPTLFVHHPNTNGSIKVQRGKQTCAHVMKRRRDSSGLAGDSSGLKIETGEDIDASLIICFLACIDEIDRRYRAFLAAAAANIF
ncbi:expressed unknown protein [Seminavis robusta]|uniref:Uncharacterized protein n=1 Tax=Seminavis robusta TaxID=568900 RepID=A0A9N8E720_9STRA|nr:expressed unknown protein [Seminavis robusta]|eukprot:Sro582_g170460.1 n/a (240) ;mRNA; f:16322-17041